MKKNIIYMLIIIFGLVIKCSCKFNEKKNMETNIKNTNTDTAMFGAGCFWCVEACFQRINGVITIESGYAGGKIKNPTYKEVCTGLTGHAEVCRIVFDTTIITYNELLEIFWAAHDPTTLNRQGNDVGTQYRSVIFYYNSLQKEIAYNYKEKLNTSNIFQAPIVTEITPAAEFFKAENYHQDYYNQNTTQPYCQVIIQPKLDKIKKTFKNKLKE